MGREHLCLHSGLLLSFAVSTGCAFEFSKQPVREHGSVGAEVFRVLCMDLAAQSFPNALTGATFSATCSGEASADEAELTPAGESEARAYARYRALVARRERVVKALDSVFDADVYRDDELRDFISNMVPLYDPPQPLPEATRAIAGLLRDLLDAGNSDGSSALSALERISAREGYRPAPFDLGVTRAVLRYPKLDDVVRSGLAAVAPESSAREAFLDLLRAGALDLATASSDPPDPLQRGTLEIALDLLFKENAAFASEEPLFLTLRDAHGLAQPSSDQAAWPTPYATFEAKEGTSVPRDAHGRAVNAEGAPLYASLDLDRTYLAGLLRDLSPLLTPGEAGHAALIDFAYGMNALLGDYGPKSQRFGAKRLDFEAPDTDKGPLFDFVHALASTLPFQQADDFLQVFQLLVIEHERELGGLIEAVLYIKERSESYPDAVFEKPHDFWDGLIGWVLEVTERPDLLEAMLRALGEEATANAGPLMGNFMRYRDRVNHPLGSLEELETLGIAPKHVMGKLGDTCSGSDCGKPCDAQNRCPAGLACVVSEPLVLKGTCGSISEAVAAHRINVNYPCENPPTALLGAVDSAPDCVPRAAHPAAHHRGIRGCPAAKPADGESCSDAGGVGLCSWDQGSCTCDCDGGLCRHGAQPSWRCNDTPTPGYAEWVDRTQPDFRVGPDGRSNQSLFQRTIALIHDLHVPAKWCNKDGAKLELYEPAGQNSKPLLNIAMGGLLGQMLGPYEECGLLNERSIVEFFARSILGTADLQLQNPDLQDTMNTLLPMLGLTQNELMERQSQIRGLSLSPPKPEGIARMVFSPSVPYQEGLLDLIPSRDGILIVDLHRDTVIAWELKDPVSHESYYTALRPFLSAMDPTEGKGQGHLDLYGDIISLAHRHWSSRTTDATARACQEGSTPLECEETAALFSYQSNLVSYEELVAEALVDARLMSRMRDLSLALAAIQLPNGKDGISVLTETVFNLLVPRYSCRDHDCASQPLRYRDGRSTTTTNTGQPIDAVAPIYLLLDALNAIDARFEGDLSERLRPWREARSKIVDTFLDITRDAPEQWRFKNQRGRAILSESVGFLRERLAQYKQEEAECKASGGQDCHQVHDWVFGLAPRLSTTLAQPVSAAALRLFEKLRDMESGPLNKFTDLADHLTTERDDDDSFAATLLGLADLLQLLRDSENLGPLMVFGANGIAANAGEVVKGKANELNVEEGSVERFLTLARALQDIAPEGASDKSSFVKLLSRFAEPHEASGESPLDVVLDSIAAVNREAPSQRGALSSADLRAILHETESFLSSRRHGLERLYEIIQSRELP